MLAGWSLRTRLVVVVTVALLPVLALSAWYAVREQRASELRRAEAVATAAELVVARHRELIEGSRRLLVAMCEDDTVRQSASPDATRGRYQPLRGLSRAGAAEVPRRVFLRLRHRCGGTARCSSAPIAVGMGFSDREIFRLVRETRKFAVGAQLASRVTPNAVIPTALPILQDGEFRGMCAVGISLRTFADLVTPASAADQIAVSLVDRRGVSLAGSPEAARVLPVAVRLAAAIVGGQKAFRDYGQDGQLYEFRLLPLAETSIFVVAAAPVVEGFPSLLADWGGFVLVVLALARRCWRSGWAPTAGACGRCATSATSPIAWRAATT